MIFLHRIRLFILALTLYGCSNYPDPVRSVRVPDDDEPFEWLSEYNLFEEPLASLRPVDGVIPYDLNTPLFSDYAKKARFVFVPAGKVIEYQSAGVLDFPYGSILIKNFYYEQPGENNLLETRLLIHYSTGWKGLAYVWNATHTDAKFTVGGADIQVARPDQPEGVFAYHVPNQNECKGCHSFNKTLNPIGPKAGNLNRVVDSNDGPVNQLDLWLASGIISGLTSGNEAPVYPQWDDASAGSLESRARIYLDVNCGHCHRPEGPANNTGLHLNLEESDPSKTGFCKLPVSAGPGTGGRPYDIVPGDPDKSILLYRMKSVDPASRMPELGRELPHGEGIELIRSWIQSLEPDACD
ncbi:MAG TPA: SO2930 family diheme c-type cytochrome [Cyclobacteriaceae bacterium]